MPKQNPKQTIKDAGSALKDLMQDRLAKIADVMVKQIMARARRLPASQRASAIKDISWTGEQEYRSTILETFGDIAFESINNARKEVPKAAKVKLTESLDSIKLAQQTNFDRLPKQLRDRLQKQAELLVGTQLSDLEKNIFFQYMDSYDTTDDMDLLQDDLNQAAVEYVDGEAIGSGAMLNAAKTVNEARSAFFFDDDVLQELDAFEFMNGDPVTPICQDLNGTVFAKDDPNMFRYTPPLHWNCKSYIVPILAGKLGDRQIEKLKPSTAALEKTIQFQENCC